MVRGGFLSAKERTALQAVMWHPSEIHGVARRANAILLLDDGWNCAKEMLELVETAFDPVALFVDFEVMVDGLFSCRRAGDDGRGSELSDAFSDGIAVIGFVGQDILGSKVGHQVGCPWRVAGLAS